MKLLKKFAPIVFIFLFLLTACPPNTPLNPPFDATDAQPAPIPTRPPPPIPDDEAVVVCNALARVGCKEGLSSNCVPVLSHVIDSGLTPIDLPCLYRSVTKDDVRKCGQPCA